MSRNGGEKKEIRVQTKVVEKDMNANVVRRNVKSVVLILRSTLYLAPILDILSVKSKNIDVMNYSKCASQIENLSKFREKFLLFFTAV